MDPFLARTMVETLSKGINPLTGCALKKSDCCTNETLQDALIEVLAHCSIESVEQFLLRQKEAQKAERKEKHDRNKQRYTRGGEAWTSAEEQQLLSMHKQGMSIYKIANILKRTPGAISSRLKMLQSAPVLRSKR